MEKGYDQRGASETGGVGRHLGENVEEVDGLIAHIESAWLQIDPERPR